MLHIRLLYDSQLVIWLVITLIDLDLGIEPWYVTFSTSCRGGPPVPTSPDSIPTWGHIGPFTFHPVPMGCISLFDSQCLGGTLPFRSTGESQRAVTAKRPPRNTRRFCAGHKWRSHCRSHDGLGPANILALRGANRK